MVSGFAFTTNQELREQLDAVAGPGLVCGVDGLDGAAGADGQDGQDGACGAAGPCGPQGEAGETGVAGVDGSPGLTGQSGSTGATGEKGETGAQGEKGEEGETGATGTAGRDGITTLGYHGAFFDTTDQTMPAGSTGQAMRLNTADSSNCGVYVPTETTSRIYVSNSGIYNLQFSAQLRSDSNQSKPVDIWLAKNGVAVEFSNSQFYAPDRKGIYIAAWNFLVPMAAGDYVELMWYSADTTVVISQLPAQTIPAIPAVPSLIATLTQVG